MQKTHEIDMQCCAWQHFYTYRRKTLPPRYQNCLLGELFQCLRFTRSSSELNSSNQQNRSGRGVTVLRAPRESQSSPPRLGQPLSHICDPRKGTAEQQEPAASPKSCGAACSPWGNTRLPGSGQKAVLSATRESLL